MYRERAQQERFFELSIDSVSQYDGNPWVHITEFEVPPPTTEFLINWATSSDHYAITSTSMVRKCGSACEFRNPETILKFRLHVGERWQCLFEDKVKREYRVLEPEWIEVPAGRFKCIRLDRKDEGNPNTTRLWYASGVGLIKSVEADTVRELVEFGVEEFDTDEDE